MGPDELDALSLGLAVVNSRWEILRWNRSLAEVTGVPARDAQGTSLWHRLPALSRRDAELVVRIAMRDRVGYSGPPIRLGPGERATVLRSVAPLGNDAILLEFDRVHHGADRGAGDDLARRAGKLEAVAQVQRAISEAVSLDEVYAKIYSAVACELCA